MRAYAPYESLVEPARPSAGLGRLMFGVAVLAVTTVVLNGLWFGMVLQVQDGGVLMREVGSGHTVRGMSFLLGSFICLFAALAVALRVVHGRGVGSLMGPLVRVMTQSRNVLRACIPLLLLIIILPLPEEMRPEWAMSMGRWITLLPLSLGLLILQCGTEELIFRGYLQSQLAARFRTPLVWMVVPSLIFGALHYDPGTYGPVAGWLVVWAIGFGLMTADLTARSGTLGPAIALHVLNNFGAMSLTAMDGYWDGLALMTLPYGPSDADALVWMMPLEGGLLVCMWLAARIGLRR